MFASTEHSRSTDRADAARARISAWLTGNGQLAGLVLTTPAAVAWATGGVAPPVDRTAGTDLVWAVFTRSGASLITTEVEADRVRDEYGPRRHGFGELAVVPWYAPGAFVRSALDLAGASARDLAADGHPAFGTDAAEDLTALRLALSEPEQADLRDLGADAAAALEQALAAWTPGETDLDLQARCAATIEAAGADAPVLIVGGDERVQRYRHPMAIGAPVRRLAMAVVVARRAGLHAAATRFASAGPLPPGYAALRARVLGIEREVLTASRPGRSYADALAALDRGYAAAGAPGGWAGHYQGGPIGYAQREFEIAPGQQDSRWPAEPIRAGHAVAWNPSLPGGAKAEDTYLITAGGLERITAGGRMTADGRAATGGRETVGQLTTGAGWPTEPGDGLLPPRPAVLEIGS